jgi:hypothetical protein
VSHRGHRGRRRESREDDIQSKRCKILTGFHRKSYIVARRSVIARTQLISPMSLDMVKARFEWLVYNEPESHLDALVECIAAACRGAGPECAAAPSIASGHQSDTQRRQLFAIARRADQRSEFRWSKAHVRRSCAHHVYSDTILKHRAMIPQKFTQANGL